MLAIPPSAGNVIASAGNPESSWQGAVDVLVGNSINLMKSIKELLKATEITAATGIARGTSKGQLMSCHLHPGCC